MLYQYFYIFYLELYMFSALKVNLCSLIFASTKYLFQISEATQLW